MACIIISTKNYLPVVGDKKALKEATNHWKGERFSYYNFLYRDDFKFVIYEYLLALIGPDIEYMELDDLHDYLDEVFLK